MSRVITEPWLTPRGGPTTITVYAMKSNKRPVGFAPWPDDDKKKRKKGKKS